jgi:hypothetical protein
MTAAAQAEPLRLSAAGDAKPAWITLLTTEHYNLQTQRAATIGEANGRASIFLGALSAGLVAIGFQGTSGGRSAGKTVFEVLVLSSLALLGAITYLRCVEISIDDWQFSQRISALRAAYRQLVPELAGLLSSAVGDEQFVAMLTPRRQRFQLLLSVAGSLGVVTSLVFGADCGVLAYGLGTSLGWAIAAGAVTGGLALSVSHRFQRARFSGANQTPITAALASR